MLYVCIPTYDGGGRLETPDSILRTGFREKAEFFYRYRGSSLLADNFNTVWAEAINMKASHFVMLHADLEPAQGFITDLHKKSIITGADVISVVNSIKDNNGLTSTAIGHPTDPWRVIKRLTMKEVYKLPSTFTAADCGFPECPLLVNTGCWICDLNKPWVREKNPDRSAKFCFNIKSRIMFDGDGDDAKATAEGCRSEDWEMSRHVWESGGVCLATREIKTTHYGTYGFTNDVPWGHCEVDPQIDKQYVNQH